MGVTVNDEVLGRLHVVGIAQEYDILGERSDSFIARFTGQLPGPETEADPEEDSGREQRTGRDDTDRERQ